MKCKKKKKIATGENVPQQQIAGTSAGQNVKQEEASRPIDKVHCDTVFNFLMRQACQVNEPTQPGGYTIT